MPSPVAQLRQRPSVSLIATIRSSSVSSSMRAFISVLLPLPCRSKPDCLEVAPGKTCGAMYGTKAWPCAPFGQETHGFNLNVATRVIAGVTTPVTRPPEGGTRWRGTIRRCGRLACRPLQPVVTVSDEHVSCAPAARGASYPASSHEDGPRRPWAASRPSRVTVARSLRWGDHGRAKLLLRGDH